MILMMKSEDQYRLYCSNGKYFSNKLYMHISKDIYFMARPERVWRKHTYKAVSSGTLYLSREYKDILYLLLLYNISLSSSGYPVWIDILIGTEISICLAKKFYDRGLYDFDAKE